MTFADLQIALDAIPAAEGSVLARQIRIIRLFCSSEIECRLNRGAFYAFALRCHAWAQQQESVEMRAFVDAWVSFTF